MFEDAVAQIRCPSCGIRMEGWMMRSDSSDDESLTEYYKCPCGRRFRVEVVLERGHSSHPSSPS